MVEDIFNLTDVRRKSTGKDGLDIARGFLVVGYKKTETEFTRLYGGKQSSPDAIIFEDAAGNLQTSGPGRGCDE